MARSRKARRYLGRELDQNSVFNRPTPRLEAALELVYDRPPQPGTRLDWELRNPDLAAQITTRHVVTSKAHRQRNLNRMRKVK